LSDRPLKVRDLLHEDGEEVTEVVFPGRSVCSILQKMEDGAAIEVAMVGNEGLIGLAAAYGEPSGWGSAIVQIDGDAHALSVHVFEREMDRRGAFYEVVCTYSKAFSHMMMVKAACHGLHSAVARCCSWLLASQDRVGRDDFPLTHDVLATVLGVRRPTVTLVLADLARAQTVTHRRGRVCIVDRARLEGAACECYRALKVLSERAALA
jgi:hypothetical protein